MVRFIMTSADYIKAKTKFIYIPIWLDLLYFILREIDQIKNKFTFQYG